MRGRRRWRLWSLAPGEGEERREEKRNENEKEKKKEKEIKRKRRRYFGGLCGGGFWGKRKRKIEKNKSVSYTHLRAHETGRNLVCRLLLEKKNEKEKEKEKEKEIKRKRRR